MDSQSRALPSGSWWSGQEGGGANQVLAIYRPGSYRHSGGHFQAQGSGFTHLLTALVFLLTLEDKARFKKSRAVRAFIGFNPKQDQSGDIDKQLGITKAGDTFLRRLAGNSANFILGPFGEDSDLRRWGLQLAQRGGKNAKRRAKVAVARKLVVLMHQLWVTEEEYKPLGYNTKKLAA
jgi:hypothetical protein